MEYVFNYNLHLNHSHAVTENTVFVDFSEIQN